MQEKRSISATPFQLNDTRDHMAADRTIMANERTFLAYLRLSLTLFVAGVSFIKFFGNDILIIIGWIFLPLALGVSIVGGGRYRRCNRFLRVLKGQRNEALSSLAREEESGKNQGQTPSSKL